IATATKNRGKRLFVVSTIPLRCCESGCGESPFRSMTTFPAQVIEPPETRFRVFGPRFADPLFNKDASFYRSVLESLAEGVLITDEDGRIVYANGVASEITGYGVQALLGTRVHDVLTI